MLEAVRVTRFVRKNHLENIFVPKYMSLFPVSLTVELSLDHFESQILDPMANLNKAKIKADC